MRRPAESVGPTIWLGMVALPLEQAGLRGSRDEPNPLEVSEARSLYPERDLGRTAT